MLFFILIFSFLVVLATVSGMMMGGLPRPVSAVYEAGPLFYICVTTALGICFAAVHKVKAAQFGLPRWRDL